MHWNSELWEQPSRHRNTELLERTLQHILDDPDHHTQLSWINTCGTAACFAGWALLLDGLSPTEVVLLRDRLSDSPFRTKLASEAMKRLGITEAEAIILFHGHNTRGALSLMVKDLVNGDALHPSSFYRDAVLSDRHNQAERAGFTLGGVQLWPRWAPPEWVSSESGE